jgi:hypothetical protein
MVGGIPWPLPCCENTPSGLVSWVCLRFALFSDLVAAFESITPSFARVSLPVTSRVNSFVYITAKPTNAPATCDDNYGQTSFSFEHAGLAVMRIKSKREPRRPDVALELMRPSASAVTLCCARQRLFHRLVEEGPAR